MSRGFHPRESFTERSADSDQAKRERVTTCKETLLLCVSCALPTLRLPWRCGERIKQIIMRSFAIASLERGDNRLGLSEETDEVFPRYTALSPR